MTIHFDDKGKYYTDIVRKEGRQVIIQTTTHRVEGLIHIRVENRLKDELDREIPFLAVTDAVVYDGAGMEVTRSEFFAINRQHIVWVFPLHPEEGDHGSG